MDHCLLFDHVGDNVSKADGIDLLTLFTTKPLSATNGVPSYPLQAKT